MAAINFILLSAMLPGLALEASLSQTAFRLLMIKKYGYLMAAIEFS